MKTIKDTKELAYLTQNSWEFDVPIQGFSIDARTILPGQIFCALKGSKSDGHDFLEEAFAKGAPCALVQEKRFSSKPLLVVDNVLSTLQKAAARLIEIRGVRIAAITGSVGKTSTKEYLHTLISQKFNAGKSSGNQNSQAGLPLSILNDTNGSEHFLVLEMGMTLPGQIANLVQMAPPEVALITEIALAHAENFSSIDAIFEAKREIFSHPKTRIKICPYEWGVGTSFSLKYNNADYYLEGKALFEKRSKLGDIEIPLAGKHQHHNVLAAIAAARELGLSFAEIKERIPFLKPYPKRFEWKEKAGILFIDDSYNANELSVKAALHNLPKPAEGRFIFAIIGSMMELGKFSKQCHIDVAEEALKAVDYLFCYGEECLPMIDVWQKHSRPSFYFETHAALAKELKLRACSGDVVLIKGSRSKQMWKIIEEF